MREILFRGKRCDNGEWVEGFLYVTHNGEHEIGYYSAELNIERLTFVVDPATVGQYTGLTDKTDKNGKKIFEGDIIKHFNHHDEPNKYAVYQVEFDERTCKFVGRLHKNWAAQLCKDLENRYEVIGNIHDNPELLKGDQK